MPKPDQAFKAGAVKPKNLKKTILRLMGYLTKSMLPLFLVFLCLIISVGANLGGTALQAPLINMLIDPGLTLEQKLTELVIRIAGLAAIYLVGVLKHHEYECPASRRFPGNP